MRLGIVMPVILHERSLLDWTRQAVEHLRTTHESELYVICNGLHICTGDQLLADLQARFRGRVTIVNEPGVIRTVAGSWNHGARLALADYARYIAFIANDTRLTEDCLDTLVEFGERSTTDLWSGISDNNRAEIDPSLVTDGADFTCFMVRPSTFASHGWFDPNFKPAYFEDNDYYGRIVLGGGDCRVLHAAQFYHRGSATIHHDPDAAHHVRHWFESNRSYFTRKWGVPQPAASREEVLERYHRHPFNDPSRPLWWFPGEEDREVLSSVADRTS
jgi:GT2 family glycosyltransferase